MLGDLKDARWIIAKGAMFLLAGVMASGLLLIEILTLRSAILFGLAVWCFCRAYYFAFYVIEHYIDSSYKYAGLWSAIVFLVTKTRNGSGRDEP